MTDNDKSYSEKRDFIRMKIDSTVQLVIEGSDLSLSGICKDLSGAGMLLEVDSEVAANANVTVILESDHGHSPILKGTAVVARCTPTDNGKFILGLSALDVIKD